MRKVLAPNRRTFIKVLAAAVVMAGAVTAAAQSALAETPSTARAGAIEVVGTSAGHTMADSHPAGFVTFRVRSDHAAGGLFALWRLRPGATVYESLEYAMMGLSEYSRSEAVEGGRGLQERVEILGGAAVLPGQPVTFTSLLRPGTYYVVNYQDLREGGVPQAAERVRALTITNRWEASPPQPTSATAVFTLSDGVAGYQMPTELASGQPVHMVNDMPQLTEAMFMPVHPGTTREQLHAFFTAIDRSDWSVPSPFIGGPVGLPALSPEQNTIVEVSLQPGLYALVTWYPNFEDGTMLAAQGQFALVTVT